MSSRGVNEINLDKDQLRLFGLSMEGLEAVLRLQVAALVTVDSAGVLGVIGRPGSEKALFEVLELTDFRSLRRLAEEWRA